MSAPRAYPTPAGEGFWWGRWHTPAPGTADDGECCGGTVWEVHAVWRNALDPSHPEHLRVSVPGVERPQPLDAFEWGPQVPPWRPA